MRRNNNYNSDPQNRPNNRDAGFNNPEFVQYRPNNGNDANRNFRNNPNMNYNRNNVPPQGMSLKHHVSRAKVIKNKIFNSIIILFLGLIAAFGVVIWFDNTETGNAYHVKENAANVSQGLTAEKVKENKKKKTSYDARKTTSISAQELWRSRKYPASPIGRMSIPSVNIHNPVFEGYGSQMQNLSYGVCTVVPNRQMGGKNNYVLAGHYMGSAAASGGAVLDNLHLTHKNDLIYVTDLTKIYEYKEKSLAYDIKPTQIEVEHNHNNLGMITLITCSDFNTQLYGYGQHRTVAQGVLIKTYPATQANLEQFELTDKVHHSHARPTEQPKGIAKSVQNLSLKRIRLIGATVWALIMAILLFRIWHTPRKRKR